MQRAITWALAGSAVLVATVGALFISYVEVVQPDGDSHPIAGSSTGDQVGTGTVFALGVAMAAIALACAAACVAGRRSRAWTSALTAAVVVAIVARLIAATSFVDYLIKLVPSPPDPRLEFPAADVFWMYWWLGVGPYLILVAAALIILGAAGRTGTTSVALPAFLTPRTTGLSIVLARSALTGWVLGQFGVVVWKVAGHWDRACTDDNVQFCTPIGDRTTGASAAALTVTAVLAGAVAMVLGHRFRQMSGITAAIIATPATAAVFAWLRGTTDPLADNRYGVPSVWNAGAAIAVVFLVATLLGSLTPAATRAGRRRPEAADR